MLIETSNNISVESWLSVVVVEETGVPEEKYLTAAKFCHLIFYWVRFRTWGDRY